MRTDVKVGLICAFAIVLCVVIYFVARGKTQPVGAHADTPITHTTPGSDLRVASPATPGNPTVTPDPILPDHAMAGTGNPISGGVISPPGATPTTPTSPTTPASTATPAPGATPLVTTPTPTTPTTPGMTGTPPVISTTPLITSTPTPFVTPTPTPGPTLLIPPTPATAGGTTYKIQKGDMLGAIARKFNVSVSAIEAANPGLDSARLKIDAVIKIPATTATTSTPHLTPAPAVASTRPGTARPTATVTPRPAGTPATLTIKPGSTYTVKKGDTLTTIAKAAYGSPTGWQKIFRANRDALNDPDVMPVGAAIKIP